MSNFIKGTLLVALFVALGVLSLMVVRDIHHTNQIKTLQQQRDDEKAKKDAADKQTQDAQADLVIAQCKERLADYQQLTPTQRVKVPAPNCDLDNLQIE